MLRTTATLLSLTALLIAPAAQAQLGPAPVNLRTAGQYAIFAKTGVTNVPTSAITGDVGVSPIATSAITGFNLTDATGYATSPQVAGRVYAADMAAPTPTNLTTAVGDMETAYTDAAGRPAPDFTDLYAGALGSKVLVPGLYKWGGSVSATTDFALSGGPNDVWIFQIAGSVEIAANVNMTLIGGAQARNVFWQTASTVNMGLGSHLEGILLAQTAINMGAGASLTGRALTQTAVTLDKNTITRPASAPGVSSTLVISQFQVAGSGATPSADEFVEIHNISSAPIDLSGYRIVYREAAGVNDVTVIAFSTSTIVPSGGYYLVAHATGYDDPIAANATFNNGATGSFSATGGGLAIRNGAADTGALVDGVGYGTATNAFVETIVTTAPPANASRSRLNSGTLDTDNNSNDFGALNPSVPRNAATLPFLPVELVSFTGAADGSSALLTWTTASETNNAGFSIEALRTGRVAGGRLRLRAWHHERGAHLHAHRRGPRARAATPSACARSTSTARRRSRRASRWRSPAMAFASSRTRRARACGSRASRRWPMWSMCSVASWHARCRVRRSASRNWRRACTWCWRARRSASSWRAEPSGASRLFVTLRTGPGLPSREAGPLRLQTWTESVETGRSAPTHPPPSGEPPPSGALAAGGAGPRLAGVGAISDRGRTGAHERGCAQTGDLLCDCGAGEPAQPRNDPCVCRNGATPVRWGWSVRHPPIGRLLLAGRAPTLGDLPRHLPPRPCLRSAASSSPSA